MMVLLTSDDRALLERWHMRHSQAYVRDRLLAFAVRDPTFAQLLGVEPRAVEQAVAATFAQRAAREAAASSDRQLALVFNHDCMCVGGAAARPSCQPVSAISAPTLFAAGNSNGQGPSCPRRSREASLPPHSDASMCSSGMGSITQRA